MKAFLSAFAVASLLVACNPCKPGTHRCNGTKVQICRPDKKWSTVQDCGALKRTTKKFTCCCKLKDNKTKCSCCAATKTKGATR